MATQMAKAFARQPLREAVSWNTHLIPPVIILDCQPLREAVSWNCFIKSPIFFGLSQPLREAVSWNVFSSPNIFEKERQPLREAVSWNSQPLRVSYLAATVSLFVRLWVEMPITVISFLTPWCQPLREAVSWNVSKYSGLFVIIRQPLREAVSWNIYW